MAPFSAVGSYLREKYHNGVLVTVDQSGNELVVAEGSYHSKPPRDDLVFLEESPDYCVPNSNTGSLGTKGRACVNFQNKATAGHGSCGILCCGRGFKTIPFEEDYKCRCKFVWCCDVKCSTCKRTVEKQVCQSLEEYVSTYNSSLPKLFVTNIESYELPHKSGKAKKRKKARKNKKRGASSLSGYDINENDRVNKGSQ